MDRATPATRQHRAWVPWTIALLWAAAIALTASAPSLLSDESFGSLRSLPGIFDVCGTPTLIGRLVPPTLVLIGVGLTFALDAGRRTIVVVRAVGMLLATALAFATFQNATFGEMTCIVD
jgi:hypothetical protein